eukprot:TRINITY_DN2247_c0_g1_i2.p1 TRINITY_DN2247_c0_g1~~TRINITY_DN2247_c0_g1_i2.p1  ORF type:complete len:220 (-),score=33.25 TRINITY_DN2247_c0_g1_i2:106-765(-)
MYYSLTKFYQSHRRYTSSRSYAQLRGEVIPKYNSLEYYNCLPKRSFNNSDDVNDIYLPCGVATSSHFTDKFRLYDNAGKLLPLKKEGISWKSDEKLYKNPSKEAPGIRVIPDFTDEDFIVWMRLAAFPDFRKIYRFIETDVLKSGTYLLEIDNYFNPELFGGDKSIILRETGKHIGINNSFLGDSYIIVGSVCIFLSLIFLLQHKLSGRELGSGVNYYN